MEKFDVAVIGGGPGGYVCAIRCAQSGLKTVLIEKDALGGTCLNRGCIPTKALLQSAKVLNTVKESAKFGVSCGEASVDFTAIMKRKDDIVAKLKRGIEGLVKGNGCTLMKGSASFIDKNTLKVGDQQISFTNAVIATGSVPSMLRIEGVDKVNTINSDGFLALDKLPESVLIVGTGVIGLEFATFLNAMGVKVSMIDILPQIAGNVDAEIAGELQKIMAKRGVKFYLDAKTKMFENKDGKAVCTFEMGGAVHTETADMVIMAAGRRPNSAELNVEAIGVNTERGFVKVDDYCKTNIDNIYAIGDVNGKAMLAHAASHQGMVVAHNLASDKKQKADFTLIPGCIYTEPEIASVGIDEKKANERGIETVVGRFAMQGNGKSMVLGETDGMVKVVADKATGEVLGLQLFNAHATDMIGEGLMAIKLESTLTEMSDAIHPHPTVNESIMEAVHDALGHCAHKIMKPKK